MSIKINYKSNLPKDNSGNLVYFVDEKYTLSNLKKSLIRSDYKFIEDICCCPIENCGDDLKFNEVKNSFDCVNCSATYEIKDGIPVLMTSHSKNQVRYWDDEKNDQLYGTKYDNYLKKLLDC